MVSNDINIGDSTNHVTNGKLDLRSYNPLNNKVSVTITIDPPKDSINRLIKYEVRAKSRAGGLKEYMLEKNYFKLKHAIFEREGDFAILDYSSSSFLKIDAKITVIEEISNHIYETQEDLQDENKDQTFSRLAKFYLNDKFSDFSFTVGETKFPVHKVFLSCRSPVFEIMFAGNFKESTSSSQVISDVSAEVFGEMLHFLYKSKINNLEYAEDLLAIADRYQIDDLKAPLEFHLFLKLDDDNADRFFQLADRHNCSEAFKKECFEVLKRAKCNTNLKEYIFAKNYFKYQNAINEGKQDFAILYASSSSFLKIDAKFTVIEERSNHIYEPQEDLQDENKDQTFSRLAEFFLNEKLFKDFNYSLPEELFKQPEKVHEIVDAKAHLDNLLERASTGENSVGDDLVQHD
ncbi:CLUMA_CG010456, isoform A [Clunio marinus]|uniref:CLUMA_CG010456, isoform A n=1 Tax=Clunio marinus TaxID=568069 RepID=A0A1J1IDN4_9DIPT|nr:CLUMA_CG010456, isoform A [Clunio marinus]